MSVVETSLKAALEGDAALVAAATGGVYQDQEPKGTTKPFVIFSLKEPEDEYDESGGHTERGKYVIYARGKSESAVATAAARIDAVIKAGFAIEGWHVVVLHRKSRISAKEILEVTTETWWVEGGVYEFEFEEEEA